MTGKSEDESIMVARCAAQRECGVQLLRAERGQELPCLPARVGHLGNWASFFRALSLPENRNDPA